MSDPIDIAEGYSAEPYGDGYIICHSGGGRAVAQLDIAAAVREITRLRALAAQVPQPVAWLCEWIDPEDQSITWHQYHDASDPMPDKWDDPPQRVTPLAAAPGASPPAALAVPAGMALVPVEPTPEMLYPDLQTAGPGTQLGDMCAGFGREIWARMLAASQESATTRGGVSRNA
jgi:hypothetical protein